MSLKIITFILFSILVFSSKEQNFNENKLYLNQNKTNITTLRKLIEDFQQTNPTKFGGIFNFMMELAMFIYEYFEGNDIMDSTFYNEEFNKCIYQGIIEHLDDKNLLNTCMVGSGKALNDFGNEFECDNIFQSKAQYFTLHFNLNNYSTIQSEESINVLKFLDQHYFYIGLCLPKECKDALQFLIKDIEILDIIHEKGDLSSFVSYYKDDVVKMSSEISKIYGYTIIGFIVIVMIKIFIGTIRINIINKGYKVYFAEKKNKRTLKKIRKNKDNKNEKENKDNKEAKEEEGLKNENNDDEIKKGNNSSLLSMQYDEKNNSITNFYNQKINGLLPNDELNLYNPFSDNEKKFPLYIKIIKSLDFYDNVYTLSALSNKYYNSFKINRLNLIRLILMIMSIIYQIVYAQLDLPYRYYINPHFYKAFNFIIIKFCINASTFWITLDSVIIGYKIMSYIKKEIQLSRNRTINILNLAKFLLLVIPKFFMFFFAFVYLHIFASKLTLELCKSNQVFSSFLYYNDTIQQRTYSIRQTDQNFMKIFNNFIPFKLNYIDYFEKVEHQEDLYVNHTEYNISVHDKNLTIEDFKLDASGYELPSPFLTNTDLFVNVYFNEFYLLILMLIITYISYKLRSKIFDYLILCINIILYFVPLLKMYNEKDHKYTLRYVLGQNYSEKYTHYFINFFYFGFMIGVMKFYHEENLLNMNKKEQNPQEFELPFEFCQKIITSINKLQFWLKRTILLLSLIFMILIASSFNIMQLEYKKSDEIHLYNLYDKNSFILFLFIFEKNLSGIFFFIFLMMYIVYPKTTNIIQLAESNGFTILERVSSCFYCSFCYIIYAQFCLFIIYFQFTYMNLFLNTLGIFLIIFTFSLFNTTILELPLRQLIKSFMNKDLERKFKYYYENNRIQINVNTSIRNI